MNITQQYVNSIAYRTMACAIEVHKQLGAGLLESIYHACLVHELKLQGLDVQEQVAVPIIYKGIATKDPLRLDILVNNLVIVEVKAVDTLAPIFDAQLLTYMKLGQKPKGLLINFNSIQLVKASKPFVNELFAALPKE
ncbi:MAG: GxxExxY protein [Thermoflexibacteraceae bacterium]